jgi:hypothetical protein
MNQPTHAWIAIRAVELIRDEGKTPDLVSLLEPYIKDAALGSWLPDLGDAKTGGGYTDNHILKMEPIAKPKEQDSYFIIPKKELVKILGKERSVVDLIKADDSLDNTDDWWGKPYKANPEPGKHLANRAMAVSIMNTDLLLLGDDKIQDLIPGAPKFGKEDIKPIVKTNSAQIALYFFMLSHFIADSCVPMHCDARVLSSSKKGKLHGELESHWGSIIGDVFLKQNIKGKQASQLIKAARSVSERANIQFDSGIPTLSSSDIWKEVIYLARASFAVSCIIAPWKKYGAKSLATPSISDLFGAKNNPSLEAVDHAVLHDAVLNVAIAWKHIWLKFHEKKSKNGSSVR